MADAQRRRAHFSFDQVQPLAQNSFAQKPCGDYIALQRVGKPALVLMLFDDDDSPRFAEIGDLQIEQPRQKSEREESSIFSPSKWTDHSPSFCPSQSHNSPGKDDDPYFKDK
jgi:hypothetical protein